MIKNNKSITAGTLTITLLIMLSSFCCSTDAYSADPGVKKIRIAVFPFNDIRFKSLDMNISAVLKAELFKHEFIDIVPVEIIRETIYEIEPAFLWTGKKGSEKRGGILWRIEPEIIEEVDKRVFADLSVYGDITRFGDRWRIDTYIIRKGMLRPQRTMVITGTKEEEIPEKLKGLAQDIIDRVWKDNILNTAEEDIRKYMGGVYSYGAVMYKIKGRLDSIPDSIPLRSLLLDLYLKEKDVKQDMIINEGLKIIELYDPSQEDDTRYLLSLSLDPFDAVAEVYETRNDWKPAIETRNKALTAFPYNTENHKEALGRDHFYFGLSLEEKKENKKALDNYNKTLEYLPRSSEYYIMAKERIDRLSESDKPGD